MQKHELRIILQDILSIYLKIRLANIQKETK